MYFFLMEDITFWSVKTREHRSYGQNSISRNNPPTQYPELDPGQLECLGPPLLPTSCPQQIKRPPSSGFGLK